MHRDKRALASQSDQAVMSGPLRFESTQTRCRVILPPTTSGRETVLAFSHHKAGSTMLYGILEDLAKIVGVTYVSVPSELFRRGIEPRLVEFDVDWHATGYCFAGFRFSPGPLPLLETARSILLVRDPRDAVVSLYYSARESHPLPSHGALRQRLVSRRERARLTPIDEWVIENHGAVTETLAGYVAQGLLSRRNVAVYRYEDVIYRKRAWVDDMLSWYGWTAPEDVIEGVVRKYDVFPQKTFPDRHIRQVHPGNHRNVLRPATCEKLNVCFGDLLAALGYATG
jgi:hypothetical protein